ncbi:Putative fructose-6-phosphate aldolase (FSA) [Rhodobacterales bacterium HTCC2150]|nr:Putative fructose-6-phosphate aldolase (FSA) [Rhodobacterales bacterium HTCC2150] [Rhodobacteraceae bacterium HTCC2150]
MKLYLDSADVADWSAFMPFGLFKGITTNPLLADRAGLDYAQIDWSALFALAHRLGARELHAQLYGDPEGYAGWAEKLYAAGNNNGVTAVVKVPLVEPALRQFANIKALGGKTLLTACYDAKQALIANALDADYLAPYLGRMADQGMDAFAHLDQMNTITKTGSCQVLAASVRSACDLVKIATSGTPAATFGAKVAQELVFDQSSIKAWKDFEATIK